MIMPSLLMSVTGVFSPWLEVSASLHASQRRARPFFQRSRTAVA